MLFREFRKQWVYSVFFSAVFVLISYFLQLGYLNYTESSAQYAAFRNLRDKEIFALKMDKQFTAIPDGDYDAETAQKSLRLLFEEGMAFSHFDSFQTTVILGEFAKVFGIAEASLSENTVFLNDSSIEVAKNECVPVGLLGFDMKSIRLVCGGDMPGGIYFLQGTHGVAFSGKTATYLTAQSFFEEYIAKLPNHRKIEVLEQVYRNLHMIAENGSTPSDSIAAAAKEANKMGFAKLEPVYISAKLRKSVDSNRDALVTAMAFTAMLTGMLFAGVIVRCIHLSMRVSREFQIHHYFGAGFSDLYFRIAVILAIQFLPSAVLVRIILPAGAVRAALLVFLLGMSAMFSVFIVSRVLGTYNKSERI